MSRLPSQPGSHSRTTQSFPAFQQPRTVNLHSFFFPRPQFCRIFIAGYEAFPFLPIAALRLVLVSNGNLDFAIIAVQLQCWLQIRERHARDRERRCSACQLLRTLSIFFTHRKIGWLHEGTFSTRSWRRALRAPCGGIHATRRSFSAFHFREATTLILWART